METREELNQRLQEYIEPIKEMGTNIFVLFDMLKSVRDSDDKSVALLQLIRKAKSAGVDEMLAFAIAHAATAGLCFTILNMDADLLQRKLDEHLNENDIPKS